MGVSRKSTIVLLTCAFAAVAAAITDLNPLSDAFIDLINSQQTTWKAGRNFHSNTPMITIKNLFGLHPDSNVDSLPNFAHDVKLIASLPDHFDPREKWPNCPSLNEIRDQGGCGSCWAFAAVEAMTDRVCVASNGTKQFHFAAEDLLSCCTDCGGGCNGGYPSLAWDYWVSEGIVSGGNYNSNQGCRPYPLAPCDHHPHKGFEDKIAPCTHHATPECLRTCEEGYNVDYKNDKQFGKTAYAIKDGEEQIMAELFKNGPVEAAFDVYADFLTYKSGVYQHIEGQLLGGHAVKMIGWGVEKDIKYWLIANSWNEGFGEKGFFKILRGTNHCGIEDGIVAGIPAFK